MGLSSNEKKIKTENETVHPRSWCFDLWACVVHDHLYVTITMRLRVFLQKFITPAYLCAYLDRVSVNPAHGLMNGKLYWKRHAGDKFTDLFGAAVGAQILDGVRRRQSTSNDIRQALLVTIFSLTFFFSFDWQNCDQILNQYVCVCVFLQEYVRREKKIKKRRARALVKPKIPRQCRWSGMQKKFRH